MNEWQYGDCALNKIGVRYRGIMRLTNECLHCMSGGNAIGSLSSC